MAMISIKKHLGGSPEAAKLFEAYLQVIEETLALSRDRMRAPASKQEGGEELSRWVASLRKQKDGEGVDRARADILRMLNARWDTMETYLRERESELTAIIALLAETAAKLDESNRDYYHNLHRSVETLKAIGEIDDISVLRRALSVHLKQLKGTVTQQETVSRQSISDLQAGLDQAQSKAKAVGQLVSTAPLSRFLSRRHAEAKQEGSVPLALRPGEKPSTAEAERPHDRGQKAARQATRPDSSAENATARQAPKPSGARALQAAHRDGTKFTRDGSVEGTDRSVPQLQPEPGQHSSENRSTVARDQVRVEASAPSTLETVPSAVLPESMQASGPVPEPTPQLPQQRQVKDQDRAVNHLRQLGSKTASKLIPETPSQPEIIIAPALSTIRESRGDLAKAAAHQSQPQRRPAGNVAGPPEPSKAASRGDTKGFCQSVAETAYTIKIQAPPRVQLSLTSDDIDLTSMTRTEGSERKLSTSRPQAVEAVDYRQVSADRKSTRRQVIHSKVVVASSNTLSVRSPATAPAASNSEGPILSRKPVGNTEPHRLSAQTARNQQPGLPVRGRTTPPAFHSAPEAEAGATARHGNTLAATELGLASTVPRYVSVAPDAVMPPEGWQPDATTPSQSEAEGEAAKQAQPAILSPQQTQPQASDKPDREQLAAPETRAANAPRPAENAVTPTPRPQAVTQSRATAAESPETQAAGKQETGSPRAIERIVEMASLQKKLDANRMNVLLHDERLGRVVVRLTERAGLVDAMVRADTTRAREVIAEHLPSLMESLGRRGLQAFASLGGQDSGRDEAYRQQGGRSRHPRHFVRRGRRAQHDPSVFLEQLSFGEFLQYLPTPTCISSIGMKPMEGNSVLELNPSLVFPMLDMLLGGTGAAISEATREITEIERSIVEGVVRIILHDLREAWAPVAELTFTVEATETQPQLMQILSPNEAIVAIGFEITMGEARGMMNFGVPSILVKMMGQKFEQQWSIQRSTGSLDERHRMQALVKRVPVGIDAQLVGAKVTVRDLLGLQAGEVVSLDLPLRRQAQLHVNGKSKFKGEVVAVENFRGVLVQEVKPKGH